MVAKDAPHLIFAAQALFGIGKGGGAQILDPHALPDAGQDIGQPPTPPVMHDRPCRGDGQQVKRLRQPARGGETGRILPVIGRRHQQMHLGLSRRDKPRGIAPPFGAGLVGGVQQQRQTIGKFQHIVSGQLACALFCPSPPSRQDTAQVSPAQSVTRQRGQGETTGQHQTSGGHQARQMVDGRTRGRRQMRGLGRADGIGARGLVIRDLLRDFLQLRPCPHHP